MKRSRDVKETGMYVDLDLIGGARVPAFIAVAGQSFSSLFSLALVWFVLGHGFFSWAPRRRRTGAVRGLLGPNCYEFDPYVRSTLRNVRSCKKKVFVFTSIHARSLAS